MVASSASREARIAGLLAAAITPERVCHLLEIMVKCMESWESGQVLPIESTFIPSTFDDADMLGAGAYLADDPGHAT